jgi:hypothetical protein
MTSFFLGANGIPVLKMSEYQVVAKCKLPPNESSGNLYKDIYRDPIRLVVVWFNLSVGDYINIARPVPIA